MHRSPGRHDGLVDGGEERARILARERGAARTCPGVIAVVDGRALAAAEIAWQKSRAAYVGKQAGGWLKTANRAPAV